MTSDRLSAAVVKAIGDSAMPRVDEAKLVDVFGPDEGRALADQVSALVSEAVSMPIEWGDMTLKQGVEDILSRFHQLHPELSQDALHQIGRCVGWNLR